MNTTWPDGVLYRYLGICGATVDIRKQGRHDHKGTCSGCPDSIEYTTLPVAAAWGQKHAAVCRALPAPATLPDGVLHRARTIGGGVISITSGTTAAAFTSTAVCTGCSETKTFTVGRHYEDGDPGEVALGRAVAWAREHATCPFIPRPGGTQ